VVPMSESAILDDNQDENQHSEDIQRLIQPQDHEFTAHFNYANGLDSWFAFDSIVKEHNGSYETTTEALGEEWDVTLYYQDSAIIPPRGGVTPNGTTIEHNEIREFRLKLEAQDEVGEKKVNYHIRPRWQKMRVQPDEGDEHVLSVPHELVSDSDAVNVRVSGSNINFGDYGELLMCAASACDVSGHHFLEFHRHQSSNIQDGAMYVRIHHDVSGPIHARTGPLVSLAHVLENDREGYRKLVQNDSNERNQQLPGYYHTVTLGPSRVHEVFPNHELPVECKHYYAREALDRPSDSPLRHPKLEVAYQQSRWDETLHLTDDNLAQLHEELTEWLYAILNDADLDLRAGGSTYVADQYFSADNHTTTASLINLNLSEVRHEQESVVFKHFGSGLAPTDKETLQHLVSDGGTVSPQDIADENDRHQDTVYAALSRMEDLVEHQYGEVSLRSTYVSQLVADALQQAEEAIGKAYEASAKAKQAAERGLDETTEKFIGWTEQYGVNYEDKSDSLTIDLGRISTEDGDKSVRALIREGFNLWQAMGRDEITFRTAKVHWESPDKGIQLKSVSTDTPTRWKGHVVKAFRLMKDTNCRW
jgi:hypothetical protein